MVRKISLKYGTIRQTIENLFEMRCERIWTKRWVMF